MSIGIINMWSVGIDCWLDTRGTPLPVNVRALCECKFVSPLNITKDIINKY